MLCSKFSLIVQVTMNKQLLTIKYNLSLYVLKIRNCDFISPHFSFFIVIISFLLHVLSFCHRMQIKKNKQMEVKNPKETQDSEYNKSFVYLFFFLWMKLHQNALMLSKCCPLEERHRMCKWLTKVWIATVG